MGHAISPHETEQLKAAIRAWGRELGFDAIGFAGIELGAAEARLADWLAKGYHGDMDYMARHGGKRARPAELLPGTRTVITARLDYLPAGHAADAILRDAERAYVSRYALGRDYHKVMRNRLQKLAERIAVETGAFDYRVFTDSAPVMEVDLAAQSGLGWRGKHTLLIDRHAGSWFFLGEIYCDLDLAPDPPKANHCGTCQACLDICPTQAIVAPHEVDARRCISYLTIELPGSIPIELRPLMGNRIYGCDDCQLACPWNRFARATREADFAPRNGLDTATLVALFGWTEAEFDARLAGSPIRRIGHERWLRNIAVALGNGPVATAALAALQTRRDHPSALVREHVAWALDRLKPGTAL
ncbi:MAG: tRNA epoxyqueuosine(34) reductase QueG [Betaproteobacteria bacterium]|nr:tRNA epoxyqueuosine(34) reductase QueG [Betaproteobacteria bacterium]